ncbi:MAG: hypothetical protein RMK75_06255 [Aquificaceae bacterium]|nr:hypothetical protein [Aquificaceae bacterium]MDW8423906.1 hypothetical protein [Aquificaceae bacterium]
MQLQVLYHKVLSQVEAFYKLIQSKPKVRRGSKLSDQQIMTLFILSYLTRSPVLTLARLLVDPSINSYHVFRKGGKHKQSENSEDKKIFWQSFLDKGEEKLI